MRKVLICGGRDFDDQHVVDLVLDWLHKSKPFDQVIEGEAAGADTCARVWAEKNGVAVDPHPADWDKYGKAAAPMRNREMIDLIPDLVVAFPGGQGTRNVVSLAHGGNIPCITMNEKRK